MTANAQRNSGWGNCPLHRAGLASAPIVAASIIAKRFEPTLRAQAIQYLQDRFHSDVELAELHINRPKMSTLQILLRHGRGAIVAVEGDGLAMRFGGDRSRPPLFAIKKLFFTVDLGGIGCARRNPSTSSRIDGMEINIPPKDERGDLGAAKQNSGAESLPKCPDQGRSAGAAAEGRRQETAADSTSRACICNRWARIRRCATTPT